MPRVPDGSLSDWDEIADDHRWDGLPLGNGLSINVWPDFAYGSLFDYVRGGGLTRGDVRSLAGKIDRPRALQVLEDRRVSFRELLDLLVHLAEEALVLARLNAGGVKVSGITHLGPSSRAACVQAAGVETARTPPKAVSKREEGHSRRPPRRETA
jgi:hypothetical protein